MIYNDIGVPPMILTSRSMILLASLVMIITNEPKHLCLHDSAYGECRNYISYIKLNLHFCVSKNIICVSKYHYEVISLNRKVQFHCKQKEESKSRVFETSRKRIVQKSIILFFSLNLFQKY